ncbi:hypothetical protein HanOQP8_Chr04g0168981 [Helianthus annuus]|nr:hypothetical protein HanOQP8_Chr04g0168981 [Helianthus annuus]
MLSTFIVYTVKWFGLEFDIQVAYTSNSKVGILDIYVFLPLLIWYCTLLASQQPTSSRIFNGIWYLQHYFLLFVNLQALRMHAG